MKFPVEAGVGASRLTPEVLRFVLGQGHTVKALGPAELVEQVKAETEKVRGMYGQFW